MTLLFVLPHSSGTKTIAVSMAEAVTSGLWRLALAFVDVIPQGGEAGG